MTAKKVRIADLVSGEWVQQDGMEPSYVVAKTGERVSRARLLVTVVSKFLSEDGNFGSMTVDDETDTMRAKCFKDMTPLEKVEIGQLVDLIGKVREYNGEVYIMPEVIKQVKDPNLLLLRKLEIKKRMKDLKVSGGDAAAGGNGTAVAAVVAEKEQPATKPEGGQGPEDKATETGQKPAQTEKGDLRKKIIDIIDASKDGIEYAGLIEKSGQPENEVDAVVNDLLSEGICYEPTPGKIKKI